MAAKGGISPRVVVRSLPLLALVVLMLPVARRMQVLLRVVAHLVRALESSTIIGAASSSMIVVWLAVRVVIALFRAGIAVYLPKISPQVF